MSSQINQQNDAMFDHVDRFLNETATGLSSYHYNELSAYMFHFLRFPVLKRPEQYLPLFESYHSDDKKESGRARDLLVYGNIRLVFSVARRYFARGLDLSDLMQEGAVGLMIAIEKFDATQGNRFSTYATWWIRQAITRALMDKTEKDPWRMLVHAREFLAFIGKVFGKLYVKSGRIPSDWDIYDYINSQEGGKSVTLAAVKAAMESMSTGKPFRLDAPMSDYGFGGDATETLGSTISDGPAKTETIVEARRLYAEYKKAAERIESVINQLSPRSAMMVRLRYGIGEFEAMTLDQVGKRYDLTRERVRQIVDGALEYIKSTLDITPDEVGDVINTLQELEVLAHAI